MSDRPGTPGRKTLVAIAALGAAGLLGLNALDPRPDLDAWFARLPTGDPLVWDLDGDPPTPRKLRLDQETRNGLRAERLVGRLDVPGGARLELAFAVLCPEGLTCRGGQRFSVTARRGDDQRATPLLDTPSLEPDSAWRVERVDLSAFAGETVTLTLTSEADGLRFWPGWRPRPLAVWGEPLLLAPDRTARRPNVLLISIDTLRADRLGAWGYERETSPVLDALAADGVRFDEAISQAPWTTPAHMSLFTSLYPSSHGVNWSFETLQSAQRGTGTYRMLPDAVPTLAELLRADGYRTLALTGGGTVGDEFGFARGFDIYRGGFRRADGDAFEGLRDWLGSHGRGGDPFFLFFHTFEVHAAYTRGEFAAPLLDERQRAEMERLFSQPGHYNVIRAQRAWLEREGLMRREVTSALYDGGIHHVDGFLGRLFQELQALELYDDTIVVVTSDHGEEFGEHDPTRIYDAHCSTLYDELIHVPLIVRAPGRLPAGAVVSGPVELIDVMPTLLELLDVEAPSRMEGRSLVAAAGGAPQPPDRQAFSEATCSGPEWKSVRSADRKYLMQTPVPDGRERSGIPGAPVGEALFDLVADPGEQRNLLESDPTLASDLRARVLDHFQGVAAHRDGTAPTRGVSTDALAQLRALGYVE